MQAKLLESGQASQSARRVAITRAVHQLLDEPVVLPDPFALTILGAAMEQAVRDDPFQFNDMPMRGMRASIVARSRLAEDELQRALASGVRQYVVLGAGLDTFALRNPYRQAGLRTFEVDHPATQKHKLEVLARAGIVLPGSAQYVPVDFEKDDLEMRLHAAGFRFDEPACFSWLGVTVYLSHDAVLETLRFVAARPPGSSITFDYRIPSATLPPIEKAIAEYSAGLFAAMGEPWISAFEPDALRQTLQTIGFGNLENLGPADLNARYFDRRRDGLQTGDGGFRFVCARR